MRTPMTPEQFKNLYEGQWKPLVRNQEQLDILQHTCKVGLYCGGSKDMDELVKAGLMEFAGRKSFVPDPYFKLTAEGKRYLNSIPPAGSGSDE